LLADAPHLQKLISAGSQAVVAHQMVHRSARQHAFKHLCDHLQVCTALGWVVFVPINDISKRQHKLLPLSLGEVLQCSLQLAFALTIALWPAIKADSVL
jgi:hypothetical protein